MGLGWGEGGGGFVIFFSEPHRWGMGEWLMGGWDGDGDGDFTKNAHSSILLISAKGVL